MTALPGQHLTEDCPTSTGFGFRIVFEYWEHWTNVKVYAITSRESDGGALFDRKDAHSLPDPVDAIEDAEVYLEGYIKWDGCSELDQGKPHWCGPRDYKQHIELLEWLYRKAQSLMASGNWEPWDET